MSKRALDEYTYDELADLSLRQFRSIDSKIDIDYLEWLRRSKVLLSRLPVVRYRSMFGSRILLERPISELFLLARVRSYLLAYLSVQESSDFESRGEANRNQLPEFLATLLLRLGNQLRARFAIRILGHRRVIEVDPFTNLRGIYLCCLRLERPDTTSVSKRLRYTLMLQLNRVAFRAKTLVFGIAIKAYAKRLGRSFRRDSSNWFTEKNIAFYIRLALQNTIPNTNHFSPADWDWVTTECSRFLSMRVRRLIDVIPPQSLMDDGLAKLFKVAVGVLAGRASTLTEKRPTRLYIANTIKLAYCWGVTYPLVDNVLDSASLTNEDKRKLHHVLRLAFESDGVDLAAARNVAKKTSPIAEELVTCFETIFASIDTHSWKRTKSILLLLLESHRRDSARRLSEFNGTASSWENVWADTILKAALVRWATMDLCGIEITNEIVLDGIACAPFNQLGDDMWDVRDDEKEDRVTPFTAHLKFPSLPDPSKLYFSVTSDLCSKKTKRQRDAAFLGVCEVVADCYASGTLPDAIEELIKEHDPDFLPTLQSAFRVDPDAILFAFGRLGNRLLIE